MQINYPFLIDGGLSNVLEEIGCDLNHKLWSASLLDRNPEAIIQAHLEYLKAGSQCITTSSYQSSIPGFMAVGYDQETARALIIKSVKLAEVAIQQALAEGIIVSKPLIAASIGPYGAYLADGAEYRGNYGVTDETLRDFHLERIRILEKSKADFFAIETIPSIQEAKVLAEILNHIEKPAWVSFSCRDEEHINDGTTIGEAVSIFTKHPKVFAVGVNCTAPKYISGIIQRIRAFSGDKKIVVYPNSGEAYHAESKTWMGISDPTLFVEMSKEWIDLGADIIGGCCRIGPEHIARINKVLTKN